MIYSLTNPSFSALIFYTIFNLIIFIPVGVSIIFKNDYLDKNKFFFLFLSTIFLLFAGLRYEVGGDWLSYLRYFDVNQNLTIFHIFESPEFIYHLLIWVTHKLDYNFIFLNFSLQFIFYFLLFGISIKQKNLAFLYFLYFPTVVFFFSYGFIRQGIACLIVYYGIIFINEKKLKLDYISIFIIIATGFHLTALFFFLFLLIEHLKKIKITRIILIGIIILSLFLYKPFLNLFLNKFEHYILREYTSSEGYYFRYLIHLIPASIYLFFTRKKIENNIENLFYTQLSIFNIIMIMPSLLFGITTIFDRFLLYSLPFQAISLSLFISILKNNYLRNFSIIIICLCYLLYFMFWMIMNERLDMWEYNFFNYGFYEDLKIIEL